MTVSSKVYKFGPYKLDTRERLLTRNGLPVKLGEKEFDVLVVLVENAGHLLYKQDILEKAWPDSHAEISTMDVTVCRLRKKIRDDKQDYIQRVWKLGLRFIGEVEEDGAGLTPTVITPGPLAKPSQVINQSSTPSSDHGDFAKRMQDAAIMMNVAAARFHDMLSLFQELSLLILRSGVFHMLSPEQKATFFYNLVRKSDGRLIGGEQGTWLDTFDCAHDNLRITLDHYHNDPSGADRELELAILLSPFWQLRGCHAEGTEVLRRALARQELDISGFKAKGLAHLGVFLCFQDDYPASKTALLESIRISRTIEDKESLALSSRWLGRVAEVQGRYREAKIFLGESLKVSQEIQSGWLIGVCFGGLGNIAEAEGDFATAKDYYLRQLTQNQEIQSTREIAGALSNVGGIVRALGDHAEAQKYHEKTLPLRGGIRHKWGLGESYFKLGLAQEAAGRHQDADRFFRQSLTLLREVDDKHWAARAMEGVGRVAVVRGEKQAAARIFGAADALRAGIGAPLSTSERKSYGHLVDDSKKTALMHFREGSRQADEIATAVMKDPA